MRGRQRGVHIDDQRRRGFDTGVRDVLAASCQSRARARSASAANASIVRDTVGSEATGPNTPGSARSAATSARQSPPTARVTARSHTTLVGSCLAVGRLAPPGQRCAQRLVQLGGSDGLDQRQLAGLGHHPDPAASVSTRGYSPLRLLTWRVLLTRSVFAFDKPHRYRAGVLFGSITTTTSTS